MSNVKPVDLAAMRRSARINNGSGRRGTAAELDSMADEIEALRCAASSLMRCLKYEPVGTDTLHAVEAMRALLPVTS